jgi:hypothetical protein
MAEKIEPKNVNRLAILLAVWIGMSIGAAPLMLLLGRLEGWLVISGVSLVMAAGYLIFNRATTYNKPIAGEFILAGFDVTFFGAFLGLIGMVLHFLLFWILRAADWLLVEYFNITFVDPGQWAYLATIYLAVPLYAIVAAWDASEIRATLAPETAGLRSPYYWMLTVDRDFMRNDLYWLLGILAVLIVGLFVWPKGWIALVALEIYLFLGTVNFLATNIEDRINEASGPDQQAEKGAPLPGQAAVSTLVSAGKKSEERAVEEKASKLVGKLYEAAGWEVEYAPRTKDPSVDPLLVDVDLLVTNDGRGIIVDVIATSGSEPFSDFRRPPVITQAVWLISDYRELDASQMGASMVLVNTEIDEKLVKVCLRLGINLIRLNQKQIQAFEEMSDDDLQAQAELAEGMLQLPNPVVT